MTELTHFTAEHGAELIPIRQLALRAEDKAPATIKVYIQGARTYLAWCTQRRVAPMSPTSLNTWITEMLADPQAVARYGRTLIGRCIACCAVPDPMASADAGSTVAPATGRGTAASG